MNKLQNIITKVMVTTFLIICVPYTVNAQTYTVQKGDTVSGILTKLKLRSTRADWDRVQSVNGLVNYRIRVGQQLELGSVAKVNTKPIPTPITKNIYYNRVRNYELENQIIQAYHLYRKNNKLPPQSVYRGKNSMANSLYKGALVRLENMLNDNYVSHNKLGEHVRPQGVGGAAVSENIAIGFGNGQSVISGWNNSPSHKKIMLMIYKYF